MLNYNIIDGARAPMSILDRSLREIIIERADKAF